ncbi:MAG: hypothetical protein IKG27_01150 [Bacilli bacterium]|nr:hypothetical protein [Bacilli bacterium]
MSKTKLYNKIVKSWFKASQKAVFFLEKQKYKVIEKFFPNSYANNERKLKEKTQRKLAKAKTEEEKQRIINNYKLLTLRLRKERNLKQNQNYHINFDNLEETIAELNWNKRVHIKGIVLNMVTIIGIIVLLKTALISGSMAAILMGFNSLTMLINANCVLMQKYNLKRIEEYKEKHKNSIEKRQQKKVEKAEKVKDATKVVTETLTSSVSVPTIEEIMDKITTKEQALQLLELLGVGTNDNPEENKQKVYRRI